MLVSAEDNFEFFEQTIIMSESKYSIKFLIKFIKVFIKIFRTSALVHLKKDLNKCFLMHFRRAKENYQKPFSFLYLKEECCNSFNRIF